jgi:uncharacterized protein YjbI with pentapeptide repeats
LHAAILLRAELGDANLSLARLSDTVFANIDLGKSLDSTNVIMESKQPRLPDP